MIKLLDILENKILVPRRSREERAKNHLIAIQKQIQQYIKNGSKGDLDLRGTPITSLPSNLTKVGGYLSLSNTPITSLPDNLKVGGNLYLYNTPITSLPDNLDIGGSLFMRNSLISSIPNKLQIGRNFFVGDTPLAKKYSKNQIRQMIYDKGGYVKG